MDGRELKEDVKKIQDATGLPYNTCYKVFIAKKHNIEESIKSIKREQGKVSDLFENLFQ